jgi:hypothetical protein
LFIDAIFTDMGRFTFRALHFDFLHSYLYYATPGIADRTRVLIPAISFLLVIGALPYRLGATD